MMLGVIVHVPVEEFEDGVESDSSNAEPEILHIVLKTGVLEVVADKAEPASVERGKRGGDGEEPPAHGYRNRDDGCVAREQEARPIDPPAALRGFGMGEESLVPRTVRFTAGHHDGAEEDDGQANRVNEIAQEKSVESEVCDGKDDFQIVWRVESVFMVLSVAGPELVRIDPHEEGEESRENEIGGFCFED